MSVWIFTFSRSVYLLLLLSCAQQVSAQISSRPRVSWMNSHISQKEIRMSFAETCFETTRAPWPCWICPPRNQVGRVLPVKVCFEGSHLQKRSTPLFARLLSYPRMEIK